MTHAAWLLAGAGFGAVAATKMLESRGVLHCCCPDDCWCHTPGLSMVRWLVPIAHAEPDVS